MIIGERSQQADDQRHLNGQTEEKRQTVDGRYGLGVAARLTSPDQHIQTAENAEQNQREHHQKEDEWQGMQHNADDVFVVAQS